MKNSYNGPRLHSGCVAERRPTKNRKRRGAALICSVIVLGIVSILMVTITAQIMANRRLLDRRQEHLQAAWLARTGVELAAARLLGNPDYRGESPTLLPDAQVKISVSRGKEPSHYRIAVEVRFPMSAAFPIATSLDRNFRRFTDGSQVHLEAIPSPGAD